MTSTVQIDPDRVLAELERDSTDGTFAAAVTPDLETVCHRDPRRHPDCCVARSSTGP